LFFVFFKFFFLEFKELIPMSVDFRVSLMRVIKKGIIEGGLFDLVLITGADGEASAELFHSKRV
jgi:hypothetical protein